VDVAQTAWLLSRAERCLTAQIQDAMGETSVERWRTLELLADRTGHPMTEIAQFAMVPAPSLTRLIDGMVSESLVYRTADPRDGRRVLVHIAPRGVALHGELEGRLASLEAQLGPDAAEALQLAEALTRLVGRAPPARAARSRTVGA
jgi:DNA-binding MarR family transcriptional regulator